MASYSKEPEPMDEEQGIAYAAALSSRSAGKAEAAGAKPGPVLTQEAHAVANGTSASASEADDDDSGPRTLAWHVHLCGVPAKAKHGKSAAAAGGGGGAGGGSCRRRGEGGWKAILTDVAGEARAGECTAVLGPSGCGKTTLLECLALRRRDWKGAVYVDGAPATGAYLRRMSFVPQMDLFFEHLTVREHLLFRAMTTRGGAAAAGQSSSSIDATVDGALQQVGLGKCADTIIGAGAAAGHHVGISGGERKRLAIATELLGDPRVLILDEPTTGLDSNMGTLVCRLLAQLARSGSNSNSASTGGGNGGSGRIVLASIHGPSARMIGCFTHVLVLTEAGGRVAYHGPTEGAEPFFAKALGRSRPAELNAAEFLLSAVSDLCLLDNDNGSSDATAVVVGDGDGQGKGKGGGKSSSHAAPVLLVPSADPARVAAAFDAACHGSDGDYHRVSLPAAGHHARPPFCGRRVGFLAFLRANLWREALGVWRAPAVSLVLALNAIVIGSLFGGLYYQQVVSSWRNTMCMIFALMVCMIVLTLGHCAPHIPSHWALFLREYQVGANAIGPYFLAISLADLPRLLLITSGCVIPFYLAGLDDVPKAATFFGRFFLLHFLMVVGAASVSYFGTASSGVSVVGFIIAVTIVTPMVLFSGLLYQRSKISGGLKWLAQTSMMNYAYGGTIDAFCREQPGSNNCKFILGFLEVQRGEYQRDLLHLILLICAFRLVTYLVLSGRLMFTR